jgi:hypothetical protein
MWPLTCRWPGELPIVVLDGDVIAEESGRAGAGVGDQRLVLGQFQGEVFPEELGQALFDVFGFGFGSGEPEKGVIGISAVAQSSIA